MLFMREKHTFFDKKRAYKKHEAQICQKGY